MYTVRLVVGLVLLIAGVGGALAAQRLVTEIVSLGYRPAAELLAIIRPLVGAPGTVVAFRNQLIVKTSPSNLIEIRALIAELDRAPSNLLVTVRHREDAEIRRDLAEASARLEHGPVTLAAGSDGNRRGAVTVTGGNASSWVGVRVATDKARVTRRDTQRVRVLEGRQAFIQAGVSVPVSQQSVVVTGDRVTTVISSAYRDAVSGFYVKPSLSGRRVTIEISTHRDQPALPGGGGGGGRMRGAIDIRQASTTVSGELGRWMRVGGSTTRSSRQRSRLAGADRSARQSDYEIYLKVEKLD